MRPLNEFSREEARRAKEVRDKLMDVDHEPDEIRVAEDVRMGGPLVQGIYGVDTPGAAVEKANTLLDEIPEEDLPDKFYLHEQDPEVGETSLGVVWKSLDEADVEAESEPVEPADMGVIWKDLTPADFPEAWEDMTATEEAPGFATLVELMVDHLPDHQFDRVAVAVNEACRRRDSWISWDVRRTLTIGPWQLALSRKVSEEDERPPNVSETPDEDPRGDA